MSSERAEPRTLFGLMLAGGTGVIALTVLWFWPVHKNPTLFALSMAWLYIQMTVMTPRISGEWLSLRALHQRIRAEGYRTSLSAKILGILAIALTFYSIVSSW
jgi:hypothetical protein